MRISIFSRSYLECQLQASSNAYLGLPPVQFAKLIKMLPSSYNDLGSYTDQSIFHRPIFNDTNQNSKEDDPPLSFFHFPSFIHSHEILLEDHNFFLKQLFYDHLLLQHHEQVTPDDSTVPEIVVNMVDSGNKNNGSNNGSAEECNMSVIYNNQMPGSKRSSSKKDRHSKINTAKGPRDRRMRLSLNVARAFFDLQDMLGYDKASKTVEWLLMQAKTEIKELEKCLPEVNNGGGGAGKSTTSECEVEAVAIDKDAAIRGKLSVKEKKNKHSRKKTIRPHAKDLREKARARARERTTKKMWSRKFDHEKKVPADEAKNKETGTQTQNKNHSLEVLAEVDQEPINSLEQPVNFGNHAEEIVGDYEKMEPHFCFQLSSQHWNSPRASILGLSILWQAIGRLQQTK